MRVSLEMLDAATAIGFRTVLATPHLVGRLSPEYRATVDGAFREIAAQAETRGVTLIPGFEVQLSPELPAWLGEGDPITLGTSRAVLVDLPFAGWPHHVDNTLFEVQTAGYQPILAHPERYPDIQQDPDRGVQLAQRGIALQVTIGSFSGIFGKRAKRAAEALLDLGAVHVVATDAHSAGYRMAAVPEGLRRLTELAGAGNVEQLTLHGPGALLRDGELSPPVTLPARRSRNPIRKVFAGLTR